MEKILTFLPCKYARLSQHIIDLEELAYLRKDRYNKKLEKFYVVHAEGGESVSEDEEKEIHQVDEEALPIPKTVLKELNAFPHFLIIFHSGILHLG